MRKKYFLSAIGILFSLIILGQNKQLTIKDAVSGQRLQFSPEHLSGIKPYGDDNFTYVKDYNEIILILQNPEEDKVIASLKDINDAIDSVNKEKLKHFPYWDYNWKSESLLCFKSRFITYFYNIDSKKIERYISLAKEAENINQNESTGLTAYTVKNNLFISDEDSKIIKVTNDVDDGIVNGSSNVHRHEFGINQGTFLSSEKYLAFYRKDETMVANYPLVDVSKRIAELKNTKYPMAGEKSEEVTLGIYNLKSKKTVFAKINDFTAERYLTGITWDPSGKFIYIGVLNREQNHLKLNKYEAKTGKFVKTLFEEKHKKYVEPEHQMIFVKDQDDKFLWFSERDGYNHLYLYNTEGELISQITKGEWIVLNFLKFDKTAENIFINATKESPIEIHTYSVNLKSKKIKKITSAKGIHTTVFSNSGKYYIDSYNNPKTPHICNLCDTNKTVIRNLIQAKDPYKDYNLGDMKIGKIKAADGKTDLYYRLITPPDFDPGKKYPAVIYVYGGPHAQLVRNSWKNGGLWNYYMAQKGYVMITLDNRGSANRVRDFENIIHRQCGTEEVKDQMKAVELLKSLAYVDEERIGVHGWSYGGFMTTLLMTKHSDTFKAGVAGGPVIDWKYYEVMYGERYMDTPQENPEGYKEASLLNKADRLKGRLLIVHGYQDPVVVPQNSLDFIRSCIKNGTDIDCFFYPDSEHNMRGETRVHLMKKVSRYFDDFLK